MSGTGANQGSDVMRRIKEERMRFQEAIDGAKAVSTAGGKDLMEQIMSENARIRQDLASISQERKDALARAEVAIEERHKAEMTIAQLEAQLNGRSEGGECGTLGADVGGGGGGRSPGLESVDEEHGEEVWLRERLEESEKEGERLRADLEQSKKLWDEGSQIWREAEQEIQETREQMERLVAVAEAAEKARCDALEQAFAERKLLESLREQVQHDQEVSRKIIQTVKAENVRLEKERRQVEELYRADKDNSMSLKSERTEQQDAETLTKIASIEAEVVRLVQELRSAEEARGAAAARAASAESERDVIRVRVDELDKMSAAKDAEFCKEVERMERETAELKLQLSAAKMRERELEKSGAELKAQISAAHLSLADSARKSEEAALQAAAKVEDATIARVNDEVAAFKARITSLEFLHGQSVNELESKKSEIHELENELKTMKSRCGEAEASVVKIRCSLMAMSQEMDEEKEAAGRFRDQVMRLEKEVGERNLEVERLRGAEGQLREEVMRLSRERDDAFEKASEHELLKAKAKGLDEELLASRQECAEAVDAIATLRDAIANAEQGYEAARMQSTEAVELVEQRDAELRKCEASLESCLSELEQTKAKVRETQAQMRSASEKLVELSLEHAEAEKRSKTYFEEEMSLVKGSHANELAKMEALVNQKIEMTREADRERDAALSEAASLRSERDAALSESESLRSERDAATTQLSEAESTIQEYGETSNSRLLALQDRVAELEGDVAAAVDKLREVERDRDLAVKEAAGKEADRGKDKVIKGLNARVEALQRHIEMVASDLGSESARAEDLAEKLTQVEAQLSQERDAHRLAMEDQALKLKLSLENAARDVKLIEKKMEEREEEVADLNVEISQMREREITFLREARRERSELMARAVKAEADAQEKESGQEMERQRGGMLAEELKATIRNLEAQVKTASEDAEHASRLCDEERAKVESLSQELVIVGEQKAMGLQRIEVLEAKLEKRDIEVGVLEACKAEAEGSAKKKEDFINKLLKDINGAGTKSAENQGLVSDLRAAVAERDAEIDRRASAEAQQVADFDARLAELMKQVQEGEARVKELEMRAMRKDHLSQQVTRLEAELETAKMDLTKAKNHAVEAQEAARSAEIAWDKRINELESELREARTDVEDMDRQLYEAQQEAEGSRGKAREMEKEREAEWEMKVKALAMEAKEREGEIEKLEQEVASLREAAAEDSGIRDEVLRLGNVKQVLASELEIAKTSRRESEMALAAIEAKLAKSEAECRTLTTEIKVIGGNLEREVSRLAELEAGWEETKGCLDDCEAKLEEERKKNAATGGELVAEMRVREAKIESMLKELEEAKAAASRAAQIEGSHQELMSLLAEKESIISQLTQGKGSKPSTAVEIAGGGQEMGMDAESARDTRRNLGMACTSIIECIEVLEGAACDQTVKVAVYEAKSKALSVMDDIRSDWGEIVESVEGEGKRGNSKNSNSNSNSINRVNISSSSDGDATGPKATSSFSELCFNHSKALVSVAQGLASAMMLHKAEAERGLAPMLVQAIARDLQLIGSAKQKGGGEEGMEEAESSDTRIEALSVQVSRLMALMQSLQEIDAGAMRRLEARWQSRVQSLQDLLEKRSACMDAEVVKRDYALLKAQKQLIFVQGQLSQAQKLLLQQRTTNTCAL